MPDKDRLRNCSEITHDNYLSQVISEQFLSIFDKNGPYFATKKIGKNNPKSEEIKVDNEIRMEWNRAVDRALVSGVFDEEVVGLKRRKLQKK